MIRDSVKIYGEKNPSRCITTEGTLRENHLVVGGSGNYKVKEVEAPGINLLVVKEVKRTTSSGYTYSNIEVTPVPLGTANTVLKSDSSGNLYWGSL